MAVSTCIKCGGKIFELREIEPKDAKYKFFAFQCASCGGVAGIVDYKHVPTLLQKISKKLGIT
jgi:hypothetical protein